MKHKDVMTNTNKLTMRWLAAVIILTLIFGSVSGYYIYNFVKMRDIVKKVSESNAFYEKEMNTYHDLLDIEIDKNSQLYAENLELKNEVSLLENKVSELEGALEDFKNEHSNCRPPIMYSYDNVLIPSNATAEELAKGLRYNLRSCAQYFVEAEKQYGVNAIFLASIAAHESGWGRSSLAINKNNLFGYKQAGGGGTFREFESLEECILYVAQVLKNSYLTEGGKYYNGTSVADVNVKYCSSEDWASQIDSIASSIVRRITED